MCTRGGFLVVSRDSIYNKRYYCSVREIIVCPVRNGKQRKKTTNTKSPATFEKRQTRVRRLSVERNGRTRNGCRNKTEYQLKRPKNRQPSKCKHHARTFGENRAGRNFSGRTAKRFRRCSKIVIIPKYRLWLRPCAENAIREQLIANIGTAENLCHASEPQPTVSERENTIRLHCDKSQKQQQHRCKRDTDL